MKRAVVLMAIMLSLIILSTGTVFAAQNGFEAKASEKNPAFNLKGMGEMEDAMVVNENNTDLHFSKMGHIMIPGNATENTQSPIFESMEMYDSSHIEPPGRVKQFGVDMN